MPDATTSKNKLNVNAWLYVLLLTGLTLLAYSPVYEAEFIWDDDLFITDNPSLDSLAGLKTIWMSPLENPQYYPLLLSVFWIQHQFFGDDPAGYHLVTLFFHLATALAFWRLALRLVPAGAAGWCGLIFALHPLNVQSVAWVTELKNTLSGFFYVLALIAWDRCVLLWRDQQPAQKRLYFSALGWFIAAVLTKTPSYSWVLFACLLSLYRGMKWTRPGWWLRLLPMVFFGALVAWISVKVEHSGFGRGKPNILNLTEQWVSAGKSLWFYIRKLFWPDELMVIYPRWSVDPQQWFNWVPWAGVLVVMAGLWKKRNEWTIGPFYCGIFYILAIVPIQFQALGINFIHLYSYMANHFIYLPLLALLLTLCVGLDFVLKQMPVVAKNTTIVILLIGLTGLTWRQAISFQSKEALWSHNVALNPDNGIAWMNLGYALSLKGQYEEELAAYQQVLRIDPEFVAVYNDMGLALAAMSRMEEARRYFETALSKDPGLVEARLNLGNVMAKTGDWTNAIPHFEAVLSSQPTHLLARLNLAHALRLSGRLDDALQHVEVAILQHPDSAEVWFEMGLIQEDLGDAESASKAFDRVFVLSPDFPELIEYLHARNLPIERNR